MKIIMGYIWILLIIIIELKSCEVQEHSLVCVDDNQDFSKINDDIEDIIIIGAERLEFESNSEITSIKSMTVNSNKLNFIGPGYFSKFLLNAEKSSLTLSNIPIQLEKRHLDRLAKLKMLIIQNVNDIADDAFENLYNLEELTIINYKKDKLPSSIKTRMTTSLKKLSIQASDIESFPWTIFKYFIETKKPGLIDLHNSLINCGDEAFLTLLKNHKESIINEKLILNGVCSKPMDFKNRPIKEISNDDIKMLMSMKSMESVEDGLTDVATTKANTEIIAVSIAISILLILLIAGIVAFKICRGRNSHRDFQKSSSHTQQIESNYEPIRNDLMV